MSCRYGVSRSSIASASLPGRLAHEYYSRMDENQKRYLAKDIADHFAGFVRMGIETPNQHYWMKFKAALDVDSHYEVEVGDRPVVVFEADGKVYPLKEYLKRPDIEVYVEEKQNV